MDDNLYQTETNFKGESKIKEFFKKNKIILISTISIIIIFLVYLNFHFENKKNKKILLSDNYIQAKILVENEKKEAAPTAGCRRRCSAKIGTCEPRRQSE